MNHKSINTNRALSPEDNMEKYRTIETNILPKNHFIKRLRIEKRRVDRSKTSLSIVLFYLHQEMKEGEEFIQNFLASLLKNTRETDVKGWVDRDVIGMILPDTNEKGVQSCVEKIANGNGDINYSVITGTYPNHLFQKLLAEDKNPPDFFPLNLDEAIKSHSFQYVLKRAIDILGSLVGLTPLLHKDALDLTEYHHKRSVFQHFGHLF